MNEPPSDSPNQFPERPAAFARQGRFFKGNLHCHSTRSDGHLPPEEVCRRYRAARYDFIALTDHFLDRYGLRVTDTRPYRSNEFTTILGAELHGGQVRSGEMWHLVAVGLPVDFTASPESLGPGLAARARDAGAFVALAHPQWYTLDHTDAETIDEAHAVEIFNAISGDESDRADSVHFWEIMLGRGHRLSGIASDDCHFHPDYRDFSRGWVAVKAERLAPDALVAALKSGAYYSSTGPRLEDVRITGNTVHVASSPVDAVFVTGYGRFADQCLGDGLTEAELSIDRIDSPYIRITVRDRDGRRAWSNPIWRCPRDGLAASEGSTSEGPNDEGSDT